MERRPELPARLRARIEKLVGPMDDGLMAVATQTFRASTPEEFYDAERAVRDAWARRADVVVAEVLRHRVVAPSLVEPAKADCVARAAEAGVKLKSHGRRPTKVRLLGGTVIQLETLSMLPVAPPSKPGAFKRGVGRRGESGSGVCPALAALGIAGQATPALRAQIAREISDADSVTVARASLREHGLDVPHKTALRLTYMFADQALERRAAAFAATATEQASTCELAGKHVAVAVDGGRLRVRENPKAGRRNAETGHRRYDAPWREPKVLTIYVVGEDGKKDPAHRAFLDGTMGDCDHTYALLVGHLRLMGAQQAAQVTLLGDGAEWIWGRATSLREALGLPPERFREVVDHAHAVERLGAIADEVKTWGETTREKWLAKAKTLLSEGQIEVLLAHIDELATGRRASVMRDAMNYFVNHAARMRYRAFRKAGIPIGSGAVESGIRRVVNQRLKGNSIYWLEDHAEAVLHLRAQLKAGRWDDLVRATLSHPVWHPKPRTRAP